MKKRVPEEILAKANQFTRKYNKLVKIIEKYDKIAIFRHQKPDYDAQGSQMGLYHFLKDNYPNKDIVYVGENHVTLTPRCFVPTMEVSDEWFGDDVLGIVCDTSEKKRISDERWKKVGYLVKIDHHPDVSHYGKISMVDPSLAAASELVANFCLYCVYKFGMSLNYDAARNLYIALVGDSGRFLYDSCTVHTFFVAQELIKRGLVLSDIYHDMYNKDIDSLKVTQYVMNHYQITPKGVAYYIFDDEALQTFGLRPEQGKENINIFDHFDNVKIWLSITEVKEKNEWKVSIRSSKYDIDGVATKYNGGGHAQASGAKLKSLKQLPNLIKDLEDLIE